MKTIHFLCFLFIATLGLSQEQPTINDFNFESVSNPAFVLLDETPSAINTPESLKSLALYLSSGFSNTNIAVEVNPYWILGWSDADTSYEAYRGIVKKGEKQQIDPFKRLVTNSSVSLGYIDKQFEGFENSRKVIAFGGRFTLFEYYDAKRTREVLNVVSAVSGGHSNLTLDLFDAFIQAPPRDLSTPNGPEFCDEFLGNGVIPQEYRDAAVGFFIKYPEVNEQYDSPEKMLEVYFRENCDVSNAFIFNKKNIKPTVRLDGAIGYSWLFKENDVNAPTANRFGTWLTADVALAFSETNYLHVYGIGKYVDDGFMVNEEGMFFNDTFWDYGAKIELEYDRFKFSYEYLERAGVDNQFRSVGNITYQLSNEMSLVGGFGKDFPEDDNLITILGINWGINSGEKSFSKK